MILRMDHVGVVARSFDEATELLLDTLGFTLDEERNPMPLGVYMAMENALILSEHARSVTLVHRRNEFKARGSFVEDARGRSNITFLTDSTVKRFIGSSSLEAVELFDRTHGDSKIVAGDLALIRIGVQPNSELICPQLDTDDSGYILVSSKCETSARNVYAIGDVANPHSLTIATSAGNAAAAVGHVFHTSQMRKSNPKN